MWTMILRKLLIVRRNLHFAVDKRHFCGDPGLRDVSRQCFQTVKFLLLSLLFAVFYLSMSTVICIFAAFSEYGLYRDYSTGYNP